jgi:hypothetical protein
VDDERGGQIETRSTGIEQVVELADGTEVTVDPKEIFTR